MMIKTKQNKKADRLLGIDHKPIFELFEADIVPEYLITRVVYDANQLAIPDGCCAFQVVRNHDSTCAKIHEA